MIKPIRFSLVLGCFCTLLFTGCSKKEVMEVDNETQSVVDYAIADQEFTALIPAVYQAALATYGTGAQLSTPPGLCDTLGFSGIRDTADFTINPVYFFYPSAGCSSTMPDGRIRSGKVSVRFTGKLRNQGSQMILKLIDYKASDISFACDSILVTTKESNASYASFRVELKNGICKTALYTINYKFDRVFTVYPKGDAIGSDAVTYVYGEASGTNRQGTNFSTSVSQGAALTKHRSCQFIDKGIMELTPAGFKPRTIDFGNGTCDDEATFTVKENTVAFKLK